MTSKLARTIWINAQTLVEKPGSAGSLQLLELAEILGETEALNVVLAGPGSPPGTETRPGVDWAAARGAATDWQRLRYEQRGFPRHAAAGGADLLLVPDNAVPLRSTTPLASIPGPAPAREPGFVGRIRLAMGTAGAGAVPGLRMSDLPSPIVGARQTISVPPLVGPGFRPLAAKSDAEIAAGRKLPSEYVLALAEDRLDAHFLLASWTWVDASVGDLHPLVMVAQRVGHIEELEAKAHEMDLDESVAIQPPAMLDELPALFRGANAFLSSGRTTVGQECRWAMACGTPIAAMQSLVAASVVGGAAYLTEAGDARALGAACLTLLVEQEQVAKPLAQRGLMRSSRYHEREAVRRWVEILLEFADR